MLGLLRCFDETADPVDGAYTLEVSSPGLERPLRTPAHFLRFVGTDISVKLLAGTPGERRRQGRLEAADPDAGGAITVDGQSVAYASIDRARTVFVWGPSPKPTGKSPTRKSAIAAPGSIGRASRMAAAGSTPTTPEVTP